MGQVTVIKKDGTEVNLISTNPFRAITSMTQEKELMSNDYIKIQAKTSDHLQFGIGDKIKVGGKDYTIRTTIESTINNDHYYLYDITFYGVMYELINVIYRNCDINGVSTSADFDLTYSLKDFVKVIIYNLNRDYPGIWTFDEENCPETESKTITFDNQNCLQVLQTLCSSDNFDYGFRIQQNEGVREIKIGQFGDIITPPNNAEYFEVGKGKGLYTLKEGKVDDKSIVSRLYVEGGDTNLRSGYRNYAERLQLPYPQRTNRKSHTLWDGTVIAAGSETIGLENDTKRYFEDSNLKSKIGVIEDVAQTDDIYPHRTGKVTALGEDIFSFVDDTMDFDLNEEDEDGNSKYLIAGTSAKITFTSGLLAQQQFECNYSNETKTFTLVKYTDERGVSFPNDSFLISVGDSYKMTDLYMPASYDEDAEEDLWYYGYNLFLQKRQARVQYSLTFKEDFFRRYLPIDSNADLFSEGDYIPIKNEKLGVEKNIRITKISRNLMMNYGYILTISDTYSISIISQIVEDVLNHETIIKRYHMFDMSKAKRGWRLTQELKDMVFDADGCFDTGNIRANSISGNMLAIGTKSQQFVLIEVILQANVNGNANVFSASSGLLYHFEIKNTDGTPWKLTGTEVTLLEEDGGYYVYAKCSKINDIGSYYITQEQIQAEPEIDPNNYYFLIGIISSVIDGVRDFQTQYGYTRINGRVITTGRLVSANGETYFDLDTGEIGGTIKFLASDGKLKNVSEIDNKLIDIASDSKFTPVEKIAVKKEWEAIKSEKTINDAQADNFGISKTAYGTAYTRLSNYITPLLSDMTTTSDIVSGTFVGYFKAYYNSRTNLLNSIALTTQDAADAARKAADAKKRVFIVEPYTPYEVGDLWVDGTDLRNCNTARANGNYNAADWGISVKYDNTKTVIDGGMITGGTIRLAGSDYYIKAGITGAGTADTSVRIWAGDTEANKTSAPFRVLQNGELYAEKGTFKGDLEGATGTFKGSLEGATGTFGKLFCAGVDESVYMEYKQWFLRLYGSSLAVYGDIYSQDQIKSGSHLNALSSFGASYHAYIVVTGSTLKHYYQPNSDNTNDYYDISYAQYSNGVYSIDLHGAYNQDFDIVMIKNTTHYTYRLIGKTGKVVHVLNTNNDCSTFIQFQNQRAYELAGGVSATFVNAGSNMTPTPTYDPWMLIGKNDNNW